MAATLVSLTPDALLELPPPENGKSYELSEGKLIIVGYAGAKHELTKSRVLQALFAWNAQSGAGKIFAESMFTLDERTARIPDAAVVLDERLALVPEADVAIPIAPDLAVEVISQTESAADAEKKVREYLAAGVAEVWQVYPDERLVRVRRPNTVEDFENEQFLRSRILDGFETPVSKFFAD